MNNLPPLPAPKPENQERGKKNRAEGKAFEAILDRSFDYFNDKGFCQIDKTPEPMKILKRLSNVRFIACFLKKAQPDYKGTIKGGRSVMYEAKYTSRDRAEQSIVNEEQTGYMDKASTLGARCFILLGYSTGAVYCIPWHVWSEMKRYYGRKYVTEKDIQQYRIAESWNDRLMIPV